MTRTTWTLDDIRHDLATELASIHRQSHRWRKLTPHSYDSTFYSTVASYIVELGHNVYERPERIRR